MANDKQSTTEPTSILEWSVRGASLLLVTALLAYLAWDAIRPTQDPSFQVEIHREHLQQRESGWSLPIDITNRGTRAVSQLRYEVVDSSTTRPGVLPLLGGGETLTVEAWFAEEPRVEEVDVRILTFSP